MKSRPDRVAAWSDAKRWWLDLLRFFITFGLGAIATYTVINRLDDRRLEHRYVAQKQFELRLSAADQFRSATLNYHDAANDAYNELARLIRINSFDRTRTERYADQAWVEYQVAVERVRTRFNDGTLHSCLTRLDQQNSKRHELYEAVWRNPRTRGDVWSRNADEYFRLLDAFKKQRTECLQLLEADLAQGFPQ